MGPAMPRTSKVSAGLEIFIRRMQTACNLADGGLVGVALAMGLVLGHRAQPDGLVERLK